MPDTPKTLVSADALRKLLQWCEDAIDFHDESDDAWVVPSFDTLHDELDSTTKLSS
jgi:hypothetical protein